MISPPKSKTIQIKVIAVTQRLVNFDLNFVAFNLDVNLLSAGAGIDWRNAGRTIEDPAVPGTLHSHSRRVNQALAERAAAVRTGIIHRIKFAVDVKQGDLITGDFNTHTIAVCEVGNFCYFNEH